MTYFPKSRSFPICRRRIGLISGKGIVDPPTRRHIRFETLGENATPTFSIFVTGSGNVPNDPTNNRIFVRFKDADGATRGSTSVAVKTQ